MHIHSRFHSSNFGPSWSLAHIALSILLGLLFLILLFLFLFVTAQPAQGQTAVPPTALQAARMPQFAQRLVHPIRPAALCT